MTQLDLENADPAALLAEILTLNPRNPCPRWALLGPGYSGKSQFLQDFLAECTRVQHPRSPIPLYLDLKKLPLSSEEQMYKSVFRELDLACRGLTIQVSGEGPSDGTGRLEHFIKDVLAKAGSRVALVVDHLDAVPHYFARSLIRRLRLMVDQEDLYPEYKNLCVLVAGRTSLFELRQTGDSAFLVANIFFPRQTPYNFSRHFEGVDALGTRILDKLQMETGGEDLFTRLLLSEIGKHKLTARGIDDAIEKLLASSERYDVFNQIALELATSSELHGLVEDLLRVQGERMVRRDSSPDIDRFCLSGAVVLHTKHGLSSYRFRNGIIRRFIRNLLTDATTSPLARVRALRTSLGSARDIYQATSYLKMAWESCVFRVDQPGELYLHATYLDCEVDIWIDLQQRRLRESPVTKRIPASALQAVNLVNEGTDRHGAFGVDEDSISYAIPHARSEVSLELVLCFRGNQVRGLSEPALSHWLRLLEDCWPLLATLTLAEMGTHLATQLKNARTSASRNPTQNLGTRIHWMASRGVLLDGPAESRLYDMGGSPQKLDNTLADINQRCLRMMERERTSDDFATDLRGIADQLLSFLENCPGLVGQLQKLGTNFTFVSDEAGLKLPIELLPANQSHLALEACVIRRLRDVPRKPDPVSFAAGIEQLIATGAPLRVLLAGADPRNSLGTLDDELQQLQQRIEAGCQASNLRCSITVLKPVNATPLALEKLLRDPQRGPFHIFHFCGHGTRGSNTDDSSLVLRGPGGSEDPIPCDKLRLMLQNRVLWLAYLSCCYGAASHGVVGIELQYASTAHAVLSAGIPAVIGFRWAVSDQGAYELARSFYDQIFDPGTTFSLSQALYGARRSVAGNKRTRDAWASSLMISQFVE